MSTGVESGVGKCGHRAPKKIDSTDYRNWKLAMVDLLLPPPIPPKEKVPIVIFDLNNQHESRNFPPF